MIRVTYVEIWGPDREVSSELYYAGDTAQQVLTKHSVNPETRSIYLNGLLATKDQLEQPLQALCAGGTRLFMTVKPKNQH